MWDDGVYLGVRGKSGELIVGNRNGVWKTRTIRRKPSEDRWTQRAAELVVGVPWRTSDDDPKIDGERREVTVLEPVQKELLRSEGSRPVPRSVYISKADLETHGYTRGCIGCRSIFKGGSRQGHSAACRARMEASVRGSDKFEKSQQRVNEFLEKAIIESEHETKRRRLGAKEPTRVAVSCEPGGTSGSSAEVSSSAIRSSPEFSKVRQGSLGFSGVLQGFSCSLWFSAAL